MIVSHGRSPEFIESEANIVQDLSDRLIDSGAVAVALTGYFTTPFTEIAPMLKEPFYRDSLTAELHFDMESTDSITPCLDTNAFLVIKGLGDFEVKAQVIKSGRLPWEKASYSLAVTPLAVSELAPKEQHLYDSLVPLWLPVSKGFGDIVENEATLRSYNYFANGWSIRV